MKSAHHGPAERPYLYQPVSFKPGIAVKAETLQIRLRELATR